MSEFYNYYEDEGFDEDGWEPEPEPKPTLLVRILRWLGLA
jgi:hypothetical protein